jgi:hypothetical protein
MSFARRLQIVSLHLVVIRACSVRGVHVAGERRRRGLGHCDVARRRLANLARDRDQIALSMYHEKKS